MTINKLIVNSSVKDIIHMKIFELFESLNNDYELLLEDLGNLKEIDQDLIKILKRSYQITHKRGNTYRTLQKKLPLSLGANSPLQIITSKSAADAHRTIKEDPTARAIVLRANDKQFFIAVKHKGGVNSDEYEFYIDFDKLFANDLTYEQKSEYVYILQKAKLKDKVTVDGNTNTLYSALTAITKVLKALGIKQYDCLVVMKDMDREALAKSRAQSRSVRKHDEYLIPAAEPQIGRKRTKEEENLIADSFKYSLKIRLEKFKSNKSPNVTSPEEFLDQIKNSGYLDVIKANNQTYKLYDSNIRFDKLKTGSTIDWDRSYIAYQIDDNTPEYEKMNEKLKGLRDLAVDDDDYYDMREKYKMPKSIKVYLKLEGSNIVPDTLSIEKFVKF